MCGPVRASLRQLIHAVEVPFQCIDVRRPKPPELLQPRIHLLKSFGPQAVKTALCIHGGLHETRLAQHTQVL